ncbi:MAG: sugar-binding transcriptional regulator [Armatimonadota bacterium]|nr:sugar-binding transcriptional regulator [Armatimonadota bacterium]MDR7449030.1 sugar-binding transcriptional regulator [Armatimonadota bacterium]MDR7459462.1 sugar-binding transcriptional regulator [Armatimonadota bacterium]MDR7480173.1 sugar-binding transcriptional regulator [Armatimonadota bacterium]MDR7488551.1 sugar-binding transcriptional regulator [Armatimonadota bacterium]
MMDHALLARVADLYYLQDLTQQAIAERLGLSRPTVSRLLRRARAEGVVRIEVARAPEAYPKLARALERRGVREAVVVEAAADPAVTRAAVGRAGAALLVRLLRPGMRLGISWGRSVAAVVEALPAQRRVPVELVPLVGGVGQVRSEIHANDLVRRAAAALGGRVTLLHAPAVAAHPRVRQALLSDPAIRRVLDLARRADVALVGIGAPVPSSTLVESGYFSAADLAALRRRGAVGDVCTRFFTAEGRPAAPELEARTVAVTLEELRRLTTVVAVAAGTEKARAIAGAVRGGLVDVVVTDHRTAAAVVEVLGGRDTAAGGGRRDPGPAGAGGDR